MILHAWPTPDELLLISTTNITLFSKCDQSGWINRKEALLSTSNRS